MLLILSVIIRYIKLQKNTAGIILKKNPADSGRILIFLITIVKLETQFLFVPKVIRYPDIKGLGNSRLGGVIKSELLGFQRV